MRKEAETIKCQGQTKLKWTVEEVKTREIVAVAEIIIQTNMKKEMKVIEGEESIQDTNVIIGIDDRGLESDMEIVIRGIKDIIEVERIITEIVVIEKM